MINAVILKVAKSQLITFPLLESFFINSPSALVERIGDGFYKYRNKIFFECYDEFFRIESDCNCVDVGYLVSHSALLPSARHTVQCYRSYKYKCDKCRISCRI